MVVTILGLIGVIDIFQPTPWPSPVWCACLA